MKKTCLILGLSLVVPCLFSCGKGKKLYVTFHQDGVEDIKIEFNNSTLQSEIEIKEPDLIQKEGYTAVWERYDVTEHKKSFTVNAIYNLKDYYATFKAQGLVVEQVPFTINDIHDDHSKLPSDREPQVPAQAWTSPYWEDYALSLNNITVNAKYDILKEFTVKFMVGDVEVGEPITITRDDLTLEDKIPFELISEDVLNYEVQHHDVVWDFTITEAKDTIIHAETPWHAYKIQFVDFEGKQVGELVDYTMENETWASVNKPEAPELEGYDTFWNEATLTFDDNEVVVATPGKTGKKYYISFDGYEELQEVTFGDRYDLNHKTGPFSKWFDTEGNVISNEGIWDIADNISLHVESIEKEGFEGNIVPNFIDIENCLNLSSVSIAKGEGFEGTNALCFTVDENKDFGLKIKKSYLDEVFSNSSVKTLTFLARATAHNNNFRHKTNGVNVCYEVNDSKYGLETNYKKFSFTRDMYNSHLETDYMIFGGVPNSGVAAGMTIYIDSFSFFEEDVMNDTLMNSRLDFENVSCERTSDKIYYRTSYYDGTSLTGNEFFMIPGSTQISNFGVSSHCTNGTFSMTFTKEKGYIALFLGKKFRTMIDSSESKTISFDIYSTVHVNCNGTVNNMTDGMNGNLADQGGVLLPDEWKTFTFDSSRITNASDSGRFLIIQGSTAGTFYIDNIRIVNN